MAGHGGFAAKRGRFLIALLVALAVAGIGTFFVVQAAGSPSPAPIGTPPAAGSALSPPATLAPPATATLPAATATAPEPAATEAPPTTTSTPHPPIAPVDCGAQRSRLNPELLRVQPGLETAQVSAVDETTVRIEIEGVEFIVSGWGEVVSIGGGSTAASELFERVVTAVDAVRYEC